MVGVIVFVVAAIIVIGGALGVVLNANPVRSALCIIALNFAKAVSYGVPWYKFPSSRFFQISLLIAPGPRMITLIPTRRSSRRKLWE